MFWQGVLGSWTSVQKGPFSVGWQFIAISIIVLYIHLKHQQIFRQTINNIRETNSTTTTRQTECIQFIEQHKHNTKLHVGICHAIFNLTRLLLSIHDIFHMDITLLAHYLRPVRPQTHEHTTCTIPNKTANNQSIDIAFVNV